MGRKTKEQRKKDKKLRLEIGDLIAFNCRECEIYNNNHVCREQCPIGERLFEIGNELGVTPAKIRRTDTEKIRMVKQFRELRASGLTQQLAVAKLKINRESLRLWEKQWEAGEIEESSGYTQNAEKAHVF